MSFDSYKRKKNSDMLTIDISSNCSNILPLYLKQRIKQIKDSIKRLLANKRKFLSMNIKMHKLLSFSKLLKTKHSGLILNRCRVNNSLH